MDFATTASIGGLSSIISASVSIVLAPIKRFVDRPTEANHQETAKKPIKLNV